MFQKINVQEFLRKNCDNSYGEYVLVVYGDTEKVVYFKWDMSFKGVITFQEKNIYLWDISDDKYKSDKRVGASDIRGYYSQSNNEFIVDENTQVVGENDTHEVCRMDIEKPELMTPEFVDGIRILTKKQCLNYLAKEIVDQKRTNLIEGGIPTITFEDHIDSRQHTSGVKVNGEYILTNCCDTVKIVEEIFNKLNIKVNIEVNHNTGARQ